MSKITKSVLNGLTVLKGNVEGEWSVKGEDINVQLVQDGKNVKVRWLDTYSGEFELYYAGLYKKTIIVESLF